MGPELETIEQISRIRGEISKRWEVFHGTLEGGLPVAVFIQSLHGKTLTVVGEYWASVTLADILRWLQTKNAYYLRIEQGENRRIVGKNFFGVPNPWDYF